MSAQFLAQPRWIKTYCALLVCMCVQFLLALTPVSATVSSEIQSVLNSGGNAVTFSQASYSGSANCNTNITASLILQGVPGGRTTIDCTATGSRCLLVSSATVRLVRLVLRGGSVFAALPSISSLVHPSAPDSNIATRGTRHFAESSAKPVSTRNTPLAEDLKPGQHNLDITYRASKKLHEDPSFLAAQNLLNPLQVLETRMQDTVEPSSFKNHGPSFGLRTKSAASHDVDMDAEPDWEEEELDSTLTPVNDPSMAYKRASSEFHVRSVANAAASSSSAGGCVIANAGAQLILEDCIVQSCTAEFGGGVAAMGGSSLSLESSTVRQCAAVQGGGVFTTGALTVTGSTLTLNTVTSNSSAIAKGSTGQPSALGMAAAGGAIYAAGDTSLHSTTCQDNSARTQSSASTSSSSSVAAAGGCLALESGSLSISDSCVLNENKVQAVSTDHGMASGGAVFILSASSLSISGSSFRQNSAECSGSSCHALAADLILQSVTSPPSLASLTLERQTVSCSGSSCNAWGASLVAAGVNSGSVSSCTFSDASSTCSSSSCDASGFLRILTSNDWTFQDSTFQRANVYCNDYRCYTYGGLAYATTVHRLSFIGCTVQNVVQVASGYRTWALGAAVRLTGSSSAPNTDFSFKNGVVRNIYSHCTGYRCLAYGAFRLQYVTGADLSDTMFSDNFAGCVAQPDGSNSIRCFPYGSILYASSSSNNLNFTRSQFYNNTVKATCETTSCSGRGGVLTTNGPDNVILRHVVAVGNGVHVDGPNIFAIGGFAYLYGSANSDMSFATLRGNFASCSGLDCDASCGSFRIQNSDDFAINNADIQGDHCSCQGDECNCVGASWRVYSSNRYNFAGTSVKGVSARCEGAGCAVWGSSYTDGSEGMNYTSYSLSNVHLFANGTNSNIYGNMYHANVQQFSAASINMNNITLSCIGEGCSAAGGMIYFFGGTDFDVSLSSATNIQMTCGGNSANCFGAGIYLSSVSNVAIQAGTFADISNSCAGSNCKAQGGSLFVNNYVNVTAANLKITNSLSSCEGHSCIATGGGLFSRGGVSGANLLAIQSSVFTSCSASAIGHSSFAFGAAVGMLHQANATIEDTTIFKSSMACSGEGVACLGGSVGMYSVVGMSMRKSTVQSTNVQIHCLQSPSSQRCYALGSAIMTMSALDMSNCAVMNNSLTLTTSGAELSTLPALVLGTIYFGSTSQSLSDYLQTSKIVITHQVHGLQIHGNHLKYNITSDIPAAAVSGAAIVHQFGSFLEMSSSSIRSNSLSTEHSTPKTSDAEAVLEFRPSGGGLVLMGPATIDACQVVNNSAPGPGSAFHISPVVTPEIFLSNLSNPAPLPRASVRIINSHFKGNSAGPRSASAVSAGDVELTIQGGSMEVLSAHNETVMGLRLQTSNPQLNIPKDWHQCTAGAIPLVSRQLTQSHVTNMTALQLSGLMSVSSFTTYILHAESSCQPCPPGTYSLARINSRVSQGGLGQCKACPVGATCLGGSRIVPNPGFAYMYESGDLEQGVRFQALMPGYTCTGDGDSLCSKVDECGANRAGPLCGQCVPGTSMRMFTSRCVSTKDCGWQPAVFAILVVLVSAFLCGCLWHLADPSQDQQLLLRSGCFVLLTLGLQLSESIMSTWDWQYLPGAAVLLSIPLTLFNLAPSSIVSFGNGMCFWSGMTAASKLGAVAACVAIFLSVAFSWAATMWLLAKRRQDASNMSIDDPLGSRLATEMPTFTPSSSSISNGNGRKPMPYDRSRIGIFWTYCAFLTVIPLVRLCSACFAVVQDGSTMRWLFDGSVNGFPNSFQIAALLSMLAVCCSFFGVMLYTAHHMTDQHANHKALVRYTSLILTVFRKGFRIRNTSTMLGLILSIVIIRAVSPVSVWASATVLGLVFVTLLATSILRPFNGELFLHFPATFVLFCMTVLTALDFAGVCTSLIGSTIAVDRLRAFSRGSQSTATFFTVLMISIFLWRFFFGTEGILEAFNRSIQSRKGRQHDRRAVEEAIRPASFADSSAFELESRSNADETHLNLPGSPHGSD